ncbi:MAG: hypothetical protein J07HR59_00319 [Halorubrum sp. J07HR59]|nr:MAG: hypothetical protein J07HR59_00319 [Halorubrum sp. J07HR59]
MSHEFEYELLVCRWAELAWSPVDDNPEPAIVARQLGTKRRRWDTIVIEVDPDGFRQRRQFGDRAMDSDLLRVVRDAPSEWEWYRDALSEPDFPWRYVRAAVHRAGDRGLVETRKHDGRVQLRRIRPYPDWIRRIIAIENKPDLTASAARALGDQLRHDVDSALADEAWVATTATGQRIEPALREDLPVEVGILTTDFSAGVDESAATVEWYPSSLTSETAADEPDSARFAIAERAYGKGWRSYTDTTRPDCRHYQLRRADRGFKPYCAAKQRVPTSQECSGSCEKFSPEPPTWRTQGWPIEGGPGKGIQALLERRRDRERRHVESN